MFVSTPKKEPADGPEMRSILFSGKAIDADRLGRSSAEWMTQGRTERRGWLANKKDEGGGGGYQDSTFGYFVLKYIYINRKKVRLRKRTFTIITKKNTK